MAVAPWAIVDTTIGSREFFARLLAHFESKGRPYVVMRSLRQWPADRPRLAGFVISGSDAMVASAPARTRALLARVMRSGRPVIGICFGAQWIATHCGASLERLPGLLCRRRSIAPAGGPTVKFCLHEVCRDLPPGLVVDERMTAAPRAVASFHHASLPWHGFFYHPEALPDTAHILEERLQLLAAC